MTIIDKQTLRAQCLARRQGVDSAYASQAAGELAERLVGIIEPGMAVAGYRSIRGEIDVGKAMMQLSRNGHELCLPAMATGKTLVFRCWRLGDALEKGLHGVEVPLANQPEVVPNVVLVPLLAFDARGYRLGYGAGYYDRSLAQLRAKNKNLLAIGVAYAIQQLEHIPAEPHDQKLDCVVTEKFILRCV